MKKITFNEKASILEAVVKGIDLFSACVREGLTLEQHEALLEDKTFMAEYNAEVAKEEASLLELFKETAIARAHDPKKLDHKAILDVLAMMKPEKYGSSKEEDKGGEPKSTVEIYLPDNGRN